MKDAKKVKRIVTETKKIINGEGIYSDTTLSVQNFTVGDTTNFILVLYQF